MPQRSIAFFSLSSMVALVLVCGACATAATQGPAQQPEPAREQAFTRRLAVLRGKEDRDNKYLSTVMINRGKSEGECSGVFVSAQVVITAAHCVCVEREVDTQQDPGKDGQSILDSASCANSATVEMFRYEKKAEVGGKWLPAGTFTGAVRPYGQFKILFDGQHNVVWHSRTLLPLF
jgi:hypothetical protein